MKENKDCQLKFRLTAAMKEQIESYCAAQGMNVSQMIRAAIGEYLSKGEGK
jgi:16S rRNA U516 pseudouridylate synthase RsuA-like enzyme